MGMPRSLPRLLLATALAALLTPAVASAEIPRKMQRCTVTGTAAGETLRGTPRADVICGLGGADKISGLGGDDVIHAGRGNDSVDGGAGDDRLLGGDGNDRLRGGAGADSLQGEAGKDQIAGDDGDDHLYGEAGDDRMSGGAGDDGLWGSLGADTLDGGPGQNFLSGGPGANLGVSAGQYPDCPTIGQGGYCQFRMHFDATVCPGFGASQGTIPPCIGKTPYAPVGWAVYFTDFPGLYAQFSWITTRAPARMIGFRNFPPIGFLDGTLPASNSANLSVDSAWTLANPTRLRTPDLPGVRAGQPGGPLYLNFVNGQPGADAYIDGYLTPGR
jgi:Ca2+-binding RTX toxin-like protein